MTTVEIFQHTPVLLDEVLASMQVRDGGRYLDGTFGRGGHTAALLERIGANGCVIAIDRDPHAIRAGHERFGEDALATGRLKLVESPFSRLAQVAKN